MGATLMVLISQENDSKTPLQTLLCEIKLLDPENQGGEDKSFQSPFKLLRITLRRRAKT